MPLKADIQIKKLNTVYSLKFTEDITTIYNDLIKNIEIPNSMKIYLKYTIHTSN